MSELDVSVKGERLPSCSMATVLRTSSIVCHKDAARHCGVLMACLKYNRHAAYK